MKRPYSPFSYVIAFLVLAALVASPFVLRALWAVEAKVPPAAINAPAEEPIQLAQAPAAEKPAAAAKDPFQVPEGDVDQLIDFIINVQKIKAKGTSEKAQDANTAKIAGAVVTAAERVLAADPSEEQAQAVASVAFQALWHLVAIQDESALPRIDKLIQQLATDKRPGMAELSLENSLMRRIQSWDEPTEEERTNFTNEFKQLLSQGPMTQDKLQLAMSLGQMMEQIGEYKVAISVFETLMATLPKTEQAEEIIASLQGNIRRLNLPGKFMDIEGTTINGKKFDWASYRGKVVLVDFWATWCGPCIKELPNLLETYDKYHDKGFEVVGISLDDEKDSVEEFLAAKRIPWVTLLEKNPEMRGWSSPLVKQYGISGIPAAILLDKEGKVITLAAFGENLDEELEKLLGPAE